MVCTHMQVFIRIWGALDGGASQMVLKPRHLVGLGQGQGWDLVGFSFSPCYFFFPHLWGVLFVCLTSPGFPGGSDGKPSPYNAGDWGLIPWVRKILWRRKWQPTPVLLPGKSHGRRNMVGYSPWGSQRDGHDWVTSLSLTSLEKESKDFPSCAFLSCFFMVHDASWGCQYNETKLTGWEQFILPFF